MSAHKLNTVLRRESIYSVKINNINTSLYLKTYIQLRRYVLNE
jgi:hypothetical protein